MKLSQPQAFQAGYIVTVLSYKQFLRFNVMSESKQKLKEDQPSE